MNLHTSFGICGTGIFAFASAESLLLYTHNGSAYASDLPDFSSYVTWTDEAGNKNVLDQSAQTVTVYDKEGNIIAVMPA